MEDNTKIGHRFGNFHQYYTFHSNDRLDLIPNAFFLELWQGLGDVLSILDIGCNEGDLTIELYQRIRTTIPEHISIIMLGIDLDNVLIDRANTKASTILATKPSTDSCTFLTVDVMNLTCTENGLPRIHQFMKEHPAVASGFSLTCMFSITMWIHMNHGDHGLEQFLSTGANITTSLGSLLVEPQPWKCYRTAVKRCRRLGMEPPPYHGSEVLKYQHIDEDICSICLGMGNGISAGNAAANGCSIVGGSVSSSSSDCADSSNSASTSSSSAGASSSNSVHTDNKTAMFTHVSHLGNEAWGRSLLLFHRCHRVSVSISEQEKMDGNDRSSGRGGLGIVIGVGLGTDSIEKSDSKDQSRKEKNEKEDRGTHNTNSKKRKEVM